MLGVHYMDNSISDLVIFVGDSFREEEEGKKSRPEELDVSELKKQAIFVKACGTLSGTPLEIKEIPEILDKQSVESSLPIKICEELITGTSSAMDSPTSCMTYGLNDGRHSTSSIHNGDQYATTPREENNNATNCSDTSLVSPQANASSIQSKNKSICFDSVSDRSPFSSKSSAFETTCKNSRGAGSAGLFNVPKPSPYPTSLKLTGEMEKPGKVDSLFHGNELKDQYLDHKRSSESHELNEEAALVSASTTGLEEKGFSVHREIKDEAGLESWFKPLTSKQDDKKKYFDSIRGDNVHQRKTQGDRPILGMVAAHWNNDEASHISTKWWDGNGIPNSTNKYKEDQKVCWHATSFEERLEKALSEETFISRRNPISGTTSVEFNEDEESDTALSHLRPPTHFNSVISF